MEETLVSSQELGFEFLMRQVFQTVRSEDWLLCQATGSVSLILFNGLVMVVHPNRKPLFFLLVRMIGLVVLDNPLFKFVA